MFLNTDKSENGIEEFLKSMNFLAPQGQNLKYFIIPFNQNNETISQTAQASGFAPLANENQVKGVTDNIVYSKKDLKGKQSVSKPTFDPTAVPEEFPITKEINVPTNATTGTGMNTQVENNMKTDVLIAGGAILPPGSGVKTVKPDANITPAHVGNMPKPVQDTVPAQNTPMKVIESTELKSDFILTEATDIFPANTLFHFTKD
jgi:hypothetical protein